MSRFSLLVLLIMSAEVFAQPDLRTHYSVYAPCDSIRALHIKTITTITEYCKDTAGPRYESICTETFDRNGNQLTQDHVNPGNGYTGEQHIYHHFTYDDSGRIISDSSIVEQNLRLTTYKYIPGWIITRHPPNYADSSIVTYTSYVGDRVHTSFGIDAHGDTLYSFVSSKDGYSESIWWYKGSVKILKEHNEMYIDAACTTLIRSCSYCDLYTFEVEKVYTDSTNRVTRRAITTTGSKITDEYYYTYNADGTPARSVWIDFHDSIPAYQTEIFVYNERQQLIEKKTTFTSSSTVIHTYYFYYANGLLRQRTEDSGNGYPKCVKWEYGYW